MPKFSQDDRLAMTESRTGRGFQLVEFNDFYDKSCSLQQSSLALCEPPGSSAVWLGQGENRMHLDQTQVEELVRRLQRWLETGKIHLRERDMMPKVGDVVTRMLAGTVPMTLRVTEITDDQIICGDYTFDKSTGAEIDDFLDWGPPPKMTGSFIKL